MRIRYIRIYSNGSNVNGYNHFVEVQAIKKNGENVAYGKGLIEYSSCTGGSPDRVTDGDYSNDLAYLNMDSGLQHIVIDLGSLEEIIAIKIWRYYTDSRIYYGTIVQVSEDNVTYTDVFNYETDGTYAEKPYGKTIPLDSDISLVQQAENSSNGVTSCSLTLENCTVGNTLILAYAIRGNGNNPTLTDGWEKIGGGNVDADDGDTYHKLYFAKKKIESTSETVTLTQTTTGRIYLVCGEFSGEFDIVMRDDMANIGSGDYKVTANKRNPDDVILYGVTSSIYQIGTGRKQACDPNDLTKLQGDKTEERLACWFDNGSGAVSHTFKTAENTGTEYIAIVECVQLIPKKPKYLIRNNDIVYTIQNDSLVEVVGDLNAQLFIDNGVDEIPSGTLLMTLSNPEVLGWTDSDTLPTLTATVKGIPNGQYISKVIDLSNASIIGIKAVTVECTGTPWFSCSFDGGETWKEYSGGAWVDVVFYGMTEETIEAITSDEWNTAVSGIDSFVMRVFLRSPADSLTNLSVHFLNKTT